MATMTHTQAVLVGRIRDALRVLGYAVPPGEGPGTLRDLVAMAPAIAKFAAEQGADFSRAVRQQKDSEIRARMIATVAEKVAAAGPIVHRAANLADVLAKGFKSYQSAKKKGPAAIYASLVETLNAATSR